MASAAPLSFEWDPIFRCPAVPMRHHSRSRAPSPERLCQIERTWSRAILALGLRRSRVSYLALS